MGWLEVGDMHYMIASLASIRTTTEPQEYLFLFFKALAGLKGLI
jgi:hypothetical protein